MVRKFLLLCILAGAFCLNSNAQQQDDIRKVMEDAAKAIEDHKASNAAPIVEEEPPKPNYWTNSFKFDIGANQTGLFNWAAGGESTFSLRAAVDMHMDYARNLSSWKNRIQMEYGFLYSTDKPWPLVQTNSDLLYIESKWAHQTGPNSKWKYSASFDFRSQFSPGYEYITPEQTYVEEIEAWIELRNLKSNIFSPAYTNVALGIDWTPAKWINVNLAPLTGGFTIVMDERLRQAYGMDLRKGSETEYKASKFQFGAQMKTDLKFVINNKLLLESQLVLFTDYLHEPYIRVNWDNKIEWQFARLFKLGLYTWLIYDPWVINTETNKPRGVQFKETVALNFSYTLVPQNFKHKRRHKHIN